MQIRGRPVNAWKWAVLVWAGVHAIRACKLARAVLRARRLRDRATPRALIARYDDL